MNTTTPEIEKNLCNKCRERLNLELTIHEVENCDLCQNISQHTDQITHLIQNKINYFGIEFDSFVMACQINNTQIKKKEKEIKELLNITDTKQDLKQEIKREVGIKIAKTLSKTVEFENPEVVILVKIKEKPVENSQYPEISNVNVFIDINPIYIEGKYCKLERGIPQTKWPCTHCKGKGCVECNNTGQQYKYTVETLIAKHLLKQTNGKSTKFHGAGREDIDVRMLGEGRPFVIEVKHPFKRNIDLNQLQKTVNTKSKGKITIQDLKFVPKDRKAELKTSSTNDYKIYSAIADFTKPVTDDDISKIKQLKEIKQRTPQRVAHRRADKIRTRNIRNIDVEKLSENQLKLIINCQGGLYIKELISGDDERSHPSIAEITNNTCVCSQLDVIKVFHEN